ncbi:trypsin-like serine peptidase [Thermoflavimicrobium daqui]|jgi:glutamyl endopeptidase|uniref:Serine protease n=1 Tax=Thermoflavimicrobium daqui TaxID=2137476 RepID=A0A364K2H4_9BACL|nr:serine protease [Thermoflavimicrobium daqui]RAL22587.1 hypothetical protein DL897_14345 [Thermoflavimicrobium daqui]
MRKYLSVITAVCTGLALALTPALPSLAKEEVKAKMPAKKLAPTKTISKKIGNTPSLQKGLPAPKEVRSKDGKASYFASFSGTKTKNITPSIVIGPDDRKQVTDTTIFPYSAITSLEITLADGRKSGCTGWLIGPHTVATAGHCIYDTSTDTWMKSVRVYPGRNGSSAPFGSVEGVELESVSGWVNDGDPAYDYGVIHLKENIGYDAGWFGFRWQDETYKGQEATIAGYPGDKYQGTPLYLKTMWQHTSKILSDTNTRLFYDIDTFGGQSGSPIWQTRSDCGECGIGVHAYGYGSQQMNGGTRINQERFNKFKEWVNKTVE